MERSYKLKMFLWDQFLRPFNSLTELHQLKSVLLALTIVDILIIRSLLLLWIFISCFALIIIFDIYKYWKSGEYVYNYRKYKYPMYKKAINEIKKKPKDLNRLNELNNDEEKIF